MAVGSLGNKSPDSNRFTLVTPKPENGVRLQATLGNQNPTGLPVGVVSSSGLNGALSGISGLAHITLGLFIILIFVSLLRKNKEN